MPLTDEQMNKILSGVVKSVSLEAIANMNGDRSAILLEGIKLGITAAGRFVSMDEPSDPVKEDNP